MITTLRNSLITAVLGVVIYYNYEEILNKFLSREVQFKTNTLEGLVFTLDELKKYDGVASELLYLSLLGRVYDVTKGRKHYGIGCSYNYFIGKDASRSFITGHFADETGNDADDVASLSDADLDGLMKWVEMYDNQYTYKGKLIGRFYDEMGQKTNYLKNIMFRIKTFQDQQSFSENFKFKYPPCNVEWDASTGSRVWCSKQSGGVSRDWVGVPRQFYEPGSSVPRCACINYDESGLYDMSAIRPYDGCPVNSESCNLENE